MKNQDLLRRAQQLDLSTLAQIHDLFFPEIYRYVSYRLSDVQVCEDIASEVFLRLLDALNHKRGPTKNLKGWLFGTASNLVNDHLRAHYSHPVDPLEDSAEDDYHEHPDQTIHRNWIQEQVRSSIGQLTPDQQHVLALRFAQERSLEESAEIMDKSVSAVKALQFRAIASLRRLIGEELLDSF